MVFWDLLGTFSALSIIQHRNQAKKMQKMTPQMAALGSSFGPMCVMWGFIWRTR